VSTLGTGTPIETHTPVHTQTASPSPPPIVRQSAVYDFTPLINAPPTVIRLWEPTDGTGLHNHGLAPNSSHIQYQVHSSEQTYDSDCSSGISLDEICA
jgi:hypothetical protein